MECPIYIFIFVIYQYIYALSRGHPHWFLLMNFFPHFRKKKNYPFNTLGPLRLPSGWAQRKLFRYNNQSSFSFLTLASLNNPKRFSPQGLNIYFDLDLSRNLYSSNFYRLASISIFHNETTFPMQSEPSALRLIKTRNILSSLI